MKMTILAIGRMKAGPEKELCDDYLTRARAIGRVLRDHRPRWCGIFAESGFDESIAAREAEAKTLADAIPEARLLPDRPR